MNPDKRDRQKENRRLRLEAQAAEWRRHRRNRRLLTMLVTLFLVAVTIGAALVLTEEDDTTAASTSTTASTLAPSSAPTTLPAVTFPPAGEAITGETPCPPADGSAARTTSFEQAPPDCLAEGASYQAVVTTDVGAFTIDLDAEAAPLTVNNFVVLARYHFYDGVAFHRVMPGFVVQGGDPVGPSPGQGGPGYTFADELPGAVEEYVEGSVAMANSGPATNGSQFFVWLGPNPLPAPDYSLFGTVTEGLDVVRAIEADGTAEGPPAVVHTITSIEIIES